MSLAKRFVPESSSKCWIPKNIIVVVVGVIGAPVVIIFILVFVLVVVVGVELVLEGHGERWFGGGGGGWGTGMGWSCRWRGGKDEGGKYGEGLKVGRGRMDSGAVGVRYMFVHPIHSLFHSRGFVRPNPPAAAQVNRARTVAPEWIREEPLNGAG